MPLCYVYLSIVLPESVWTLFFADLTLLRATPPIWTCCFSWDNSCWLRAPRIMPTAAARAARGKRHPSKMSLHLTGNTDWGWIWGQSGCADLLPPRPSDKRCNVVVNKAGWEELNQFQGKVLKLEVRRDNSALFRVSGFGAACPTGMSRRCRSLPPGAGAFCSPARMQPGGCGADSHPFSKLNFTPIGCPRLTAPLACWRIADRADYYGLSPKPVGSARKASTAQGDVSWMPQEWVSAHMLSPSRGMILTYDSCWVFQWDAGENQSI